MGQETQAASRTSRQRNGFSPRASRKESSPADTLTLALCQISDLQNYKMINLCSAAKFVVICDGGNRKLTHPTSSQQSGPEY